MFQTTNQKYLTRVIWIDIGIDIWIWIDLRLGMQVEL